MGTVSVAGTILLPFSVIPSDSTDAALTKLSVMFPWPQGLEWAYDSIRNAPRLLSGMSEEVHPLSHWAGAYKDV